MYLGWKVRIVSAGGYMKILDGSRPILSLGARLCVLVFSSATNHSGHSGTGPTFAQSLMRTHG